MKILILGMGNPLLSDDGVGLLIAEAVGRRIDITKVDVISTTDVGFSILDLVIGYDIVFVIDALTTGERKVGKIVKMEEKGLTLHLFSSHGVNFYDLLQFGRDMGYKMPRVGGIYGIEIGKKVAFGEDISPRLAKKIPDIVDRIVADITHIIS